MSSQLAHKWNDKHRTEDVCIDADISFAKMMLSDAILLGLNKNGFVKPSPIQLRAIPFGRAGLDLLMKAKSGTGKTLVFVTVILEAFRATVKYPQSLILVPTREVAVQIENILKTIGYAIEGFKVASFIGGLEISDDRQKMSACRAVVGTPGRILHLMRNGILNTDEIKIFVLDEADKLMSESFQKDIQDIVQYLPTKHQVIASSATYNDGLDCELMRYMKNPTAVTPKREAPILIGVKQFAQELTSDSLNSMQDMLNKVQAMQDIFSRISFKQCLVFSNSQSRAESYCNNLSQRGWPTEVITGAMDQKSRLSIFKKFRNFECRILTATDLMARGVDAENVNLVINLEVPNDSSVYLHRIGRCGRFGSHGIAITLLSTAEEMFKFRKLLGNIGGNEMKVLQYPASNTLDVWDFTARQKEAEICGEIIGLVGDEQPPSEETDEIVSRNIALLQISKLLTDAPKPCDMANIEDLFENYSLDANVSDVTDNTLINHENPFENSPPIFEEPDKIDAFFRDAIQRLNHFPAEIHKTKCVQSSSVEDTIGSFPQLDQNQSFDSDDEGPLFLCGTSGLSSLSSICVKGNELDEESTHSDKESDDSDEEPVCSQMPAHLSQQTSALQIWENIYQNQVSQIQNYLKVARKYW